jgi:hypothetical protein
VWEPFIAEGEAFSKAWKDISAPTATTPLQPEVMLEWLTARLSLLEAIERGDTAERLLDSLRRGDAAARERLCTQLGALGANSASLTDLSLRALVETDTDVQKGRRKGQRDKTQFGRNAPQGTRRCGPEA